MIRSASNSNSHRPSSKRHATQSLLSRQAIRERGIRGVAWRTQEFCKRGFRLREVGVKEKRGKIRKTLRNDYVRDALTRRLYITHLGVSPGTRVSITEIDPRIEIREKRVNSDKIDTSRIQEPCAMPQSTVVESAGRNAGSEMLQPRIRDPRM